MNNKRKSDDQSGMGRKIDTFPLLALFTTALGLTTFGCAATDSRLLVAPDGSKALYVECSAGPVDCLEVISEHCPGGYEVLVQGSRGEILAGDKWTQMATDAVAAKSGLMTGGIQATPTTIREMLVRCGRSETASSDLKGLLNEPDGTATTRSGSGAEAAASRDGDASKVQRNDHRRTCAHADSSTKLDLQEKWARILSVHDAGASQPTMSATFACRLVRESFVQGCPDWAPNLSAVERDVCNIATAESGRTRKPTTSSELSKSTEPARPEDAQ